MDNYIKCYENAFSDEFCDNTITKFESSYTEHEEREKHSLLKSIYKKVVTLE